MPFCTAGPGRSLEPPRRCGLASGAEPPDRLRGARKEVGGGHAPPCRDSDRTSRPFHLRPGPTPRRVARQLGLDSIADLASNESPVEPLPEVMAAITAAAARINRYPSTDARELVRALAGLYDVDPSSSGWRRAAPPC